MLKNVSCVKENGIVTLTISRPQALNALNSEVMAELEQAVSGLEKDEDVRVMILTGEGRAFVAGADIEEQMPMGLEQGRNWSRRGSALFRRIELLEFPTIAAVNGFALGGGCELAMSCDIIIASTAAKFSQPEVGLGITPGFSGTVRLPRRVGYGRAMEMILTGDMITAAEAERIGLVNRVVEPDALLAAAQEIAGKIAKQAPLAVKYSKAAVARAMQVDIDTGIAIENELFAMCYATEEQKLRMENFINRKKQKSAN
ncbi:MAG: enoyl-CoA hydratase-related protein [Spirochaetes bacterium]|nr:enoyl-CoA hydratase-related protein [Spirochaetota bacterium]